MVVIELTYLRPLEILEQYLVSHREFLQKHYDQGHLLASGPQNPRTGGIIISLLSLDETKELAKHDPFYLNGVAEYRFTEFEPVKSHAKIKELI